MSNNENKSITPLRKYIAIGYAVIAMLIGGIFFIYLHEWRELERIETESKEMNMLRQKVHDAYSQMLDLTLYGEKVLEWNAEDTLIYRGKRLAMECSKASVVYSIVGYKGSQTSFRIRKGQAVNRLEQFLPPLESKQLQNLFLFIGLAENRIRQRR